MTTDRTDRRIVLGMPGYGKQTAAAGRGFWRASADMRSVWNYYQAGSLLACNFNQLWCLALNLQRQGERVDYFAMLHDDVAPEDFWASAVRQPFPVGPQRPRLQPRVLPPWQHSPVFARWASPPRGPLTPPKPCLLPVALRRRRPICRACGSTTWEAATWPRAATPLIQPASRLPLAWA